MDNLPLDLWRLIFEHKNIINYSSLFCFINKRVYKICSKNRNTNILNIACKDGAGWIRDPDQLATRSKIAARIFEYSKMVTRKRFYLE